MLDDDAAAHAFGCCCCCGTGNTSVGGCDCPIHLSPAPFPPSGPSVFPSSRPIWTLWQVAAHARSIPCQLRARASEAESERAGVSCDRADASELYRLISPTSCRTRHSAVSRDYRTADTRQKLARLPCDNAFQILPLWKWKSAEMARFTHDFLLITGSNFVRICIVSELQPVYHISISIFPSHALFRAM